MVKAKAEQGSAYFFDEGEFDAVLRSVEENHVEFTYKAHHKAVQRNKAQVGERGEFTNWKWTWELLEGEREGVEIVLTTDPKIELEGWSPARRAYEALSGHAISLGDDIDTDLVVGMKARLVLSHQPERRVGDRVYYDTVITDVLPAGDEAPGNDEPPF